MDLTYIEDIAKATDGRLIKRCGKDQVSGVVHDSRDCAPDDLFVCVKGNRLDGHDFAAQVYEAGCRNLLVSNSSIIDACSEANLILVDDTVEAMGKLASWYIQRLGIIRIAVTGSVGKTSTRDMIYYVLSEEMKCGRNLKNYNNEIGLPLSIFKLDSSYEAAVLEMGMSDFGEISRLSEIVKPDIGVITGIGTAHMEHLGSRNGIFRAKMEITESIASEEEGGTMIFAFDEEFLNRDRTSGNYRSIFAGEDGRSDYIVTDIEDRGVDGVSFNIEHEDRMRRFRVLVPGRHNAMNAALAVAVGDRLGLDDDSITAGLEKTKLTGHRLRLMESRGIRVIDDTYNAGPDSVKSSLKVLEKSNCKGRKTAVLGDMYELGSREDMLHRDVGIFAAGCDIDMLICIGPRAKNIYEGAQAGRASAEWFENKEEFIKVKDEFIGSGDLVLVKASRGMELETIVEAITGIK